MEGLGEGRVDGVWQLGMGGKLEGLEFFAEGRGGWVFEVLDMGWEIWEWGVWIGGGEAGGGERGERGGL